jgi:peptidoglycan/LPS O-acetylase OafA/YrhL
MGLLWASIVTNHYNGSKYRDIVGYAVDPILLSMLILQLISLRGAKWMDSRPINYLGKISYSTYLYQQMVHPTFLHFMHWVHRPSRILLNIGVSWAVAALSYEAVEKPFLRLKHRYTRTEKPEPGPASAALPSEAGN